MSERINLKITLVHVHIVHSVEHMVRSQYVPIMSQFMWLESPMPAPSFPMSLPQLQETQCVYGCQAPLDINKSAGIAGVAATAQDSNEQMSSGNQVTIVQAAWKDFHTILNQ